MAMSFRSQSQASILRSASSGLVALDAGLAGETRALRGLDDQPRQTLAPPPVEPVGDGVFVDQPLELLRRPAKLGIHQRRRQMADGHGGDAALGLRRLSRIADEERIEHRQRADHRLREACGRQRHGLAGQPFERAMRAHMHDGIGYAAWRSQSPKASRAWRGGSVGS